MAQLAEIPTVGGVTGVESWQANLRPGRLLFGPDRLQELGDLVHEIGGRRVLVVTDPGIRSAGHVDTALDSLDRAALQAFVFDRVAENPTTEHVELGAEQARELDVDFLVGLGGGSSMDCAKGINFLISNGGRMEDYWGFNKAAKTMLPSVGVPCTAGTGSEAQSFALIGQKDSHLKMACGDEKARFRAVILDPLLVVTAPPEVTAVAGFDAISHAAESFVTKTPNPFARLFAKEAWLLLSRSYEQSVNGSAEPETWGRMLLGAHLAGAAIETSMLGAAHALANPLTATFGVTHGVAIAILLPSIVRFNGSVAEASYRELVQAAELDGGGSASERLALYLESLREKVGLPSSLEAVGVQAKDVALLAVRATEQWTLQHNPRFLSEADIHELYQGVLHR